MSKLRYIIILAFVLGNFIFAQDFQLGFRLEANLLRSHIGKESYLSSFEPTAFQLNASYFPYNTFAIETRAGAEFSLRYYQGFDYGLVGKYYIRQEAEKLYLCGGLMFHSNIEEERSPARTFIVPAVGIGINPLGSFNIETLLEFGMKQKILDSYRELGVIYEDPRIFDWNLKIGAGFSWDL